MKTTWTDSDGYTVSVIRNPISGTPELLVSMGAHKGTPTTLNHYIKIEPIAMKQDLDGLRKRGCNPASYRMVGAALIRATAEPFVQSVLDSLQTASDSAQATLAANVPGIEVLRAARNDEMRYAHQFDAMMDDEMNDGVRPPKAVKTSYADVAAQYPIAAAYLMAEDWEAAANDQKSSAGNRAKIRIAANEDYLQVIAEMEAEWFGTAHTAVQNA